MDLGIKGKKALVCASSKGLGLGCAEALAAAGLQVASGMKFGTRYRVYRDGESHAAWLLHLLRDDDSWLDIVRAVRVAHGVRKQLVASDGERCLALEWVKP